MRESEDDSPCRYITLGASHTTINLRGWAATDLSAYVPNGVIGLEVCRQEGSVFNIGFEEFINGQSMRTLFIGMLLWCLILLSINKRCVYFR